MRRFSDGLWPGDQHRPYKPWVIAGVIRKA
jgi:hypothetical protein